MGKLVVVSIAVSVVAATSCTRLGYSSRLLHRVPSPEGQLVAVCQEVPVFDGPEFDVRLERPDGRVVRRLFHMGDGGGCSEVAWSADGNSLAVLTSHVAGITMIDLRWAVAHAAEQNSHWRVHNPRRAGRQTAVSLPTARQPFEPGMWTDDSHAIARALA